MKRKIRKFLNSYDGLLNDFSMKFLYDRFKENHSDSTTFKEFESVAKQWKKV
jgi:hypothetical protein